MQQQSGDKGAAVFPPFFPRPCARRGKGETRVMGLLLLLLGDLIPAEMETPA